MQLISIAQPVGDTPAPVDEAGRSALAGLIGSIGAEGFGRDGLAQLNRWMPLCWWSIYRLFDDTPPMLHALGSFGVPDGTQASWQVYRETLYRFDRTFHAVRPMLGERHIGMAHWHAREIPGRHRAEIYSRHGLLERLSIVSDGDGHGVPARCDAARRRAAAPPGPARRRSRAR
jgi:hypothetical protein